MAPRDFLNPPAVADGQGPADWSDDEDDDDDDADAEFVGRVRRNQEEIPEWIKVSFLEFMVYQFYGVLFTILLNLCDKQRVVTNFKKFQKI